MKKKTRMRTKTMRTMEMRMTTKMRTRMMRKLLQLKQPRLMQPLPLAKEQINHQSHLHRTTNPKHPQVRNQTTIIMLNRISPRHHKDLGRSLKAEEEIITREDNS